MTAPPSPALAPAAPARTRFAGAIFDVDGVLVDSPHAQAWREALAELMDGAWHELRDESRWSPAAFTGPVYQRVVAGKPRMDGALAALQHFEVPDPEAHVAAYAERKQARVLELIEAEQFTAYPDALCFVLAVRAAGVPVAAASSSRNAELLLGHIRLDTFAQTEGLAYDIAPGQTLLDFVDADVSGRHFAHGKPHPEIFETAARELGVAPEACFVVEDAVAGVQAAKAGGMAVLGLARAGDAELLADARPDLVVTSLDDVDLERLAAGRLEARAV